ncbi:MAG: hypothetical protein ACOC44_11560 [Promethearchaeia archaeon]
MGNQIFRVNPDGTTTELETEEGQEIKDVMDSNECYVIVADEERKVYLWIGSKSNVRSKFIGAKRSQEIRGQVGMHYSTKTCEEGSEDEILLSIMGGRTEGGIAEEIHEDVSSAGGGHPLRQKDDFESPRPAGGMNIADSKSREATNSGPLYKGSESMSEFVKDEQEINFEKIMQKLEEIAMPEGYERELIIIGNHAYSVVEKTQTFLGKKQTEKEIERVGSIPEGVFFAQDYSPRVLSEGGKILAIEFLKRSGGQTKPAESKSKKDILKSQIDSQLKGKK